MKTYTYDCQINCEIKVGGENETDACTLAFKIMNSLELIDHVRDCTIDINMNNGLELLHIEEPEELTIDDHFPAYHWQMEVYEGRTRLGFKEWQQEKANDL